MEPPLQAGSMVVSFSTMLDAQQCFPFSIGYAFEDGQVGITKCKKWKIKCSIVVQLYLPTGSGAWAHMLLLGPGHVMQSIPQAGGLK